MAKRHAGHVELVAITGQQEPAVAYVARHQHARRVAVTQPRVRENAADRRAVAAGPVLSQGSTGSTGLGLAIVRTIMELHGGSVHAQSDGRSTRFVLLFPRVR
ncbi:ATP-binding protein [Paraburkholderia dipogonis]|uniref:histidine kinase n=1 Tax=Paraburkholderia dipogonis TaxID=1211383 RepID=A0ABW9B2I6_9BURK